MMRGSSNTRWCPTPQQVMVLEQLYTRGLKTPTATQIQKITAHLSIYGNIQGKNVFYWFQNHKARDRQKLRKTQLHLHYQRLLHSSPSPSPHTILHFQGGGAHEEEVPEAMRRYEYRHDNSMMRMEVVGPTTSCCMRSDEHQPLQTLELFPLTASTDDLQKRPSASGDSFTQS